MNKYPVKMFTMPVLVPYGVEVTPAFQIAVLRLTMANAPGVAIEDAEARIEDTDDWTRGYVAVIGEVRYIEPAEEDREFALGLKGHVLHPRSVADLVEQEARREGYSLRSAGRAVVGQMEYGGLEFDDGLRGMKPVLAEVDAVRVPWGHAGTADSP